MLEQVSVHRMLCSEKITYLPIMNHVPTSKSHSRRVGCDHRQGEAANAKVVLWPGWRCEDICRHPVDELRARSSVATETKVIREPLELWDFVNGLVGSVARGIGVLEGSGSLVVIGCCVW